MTHNTRKTKILMFALGLVMCLALMLGILMFCTASTAYAESGEIDTLEVSFNRVEIGDSLAAAFVFEDETERTLKVPAGANYTATLTFISKTDKRQRYGKKTKRRSRGAGLKTNLSSRKLHIVSASVLRRKKIINFPKKQTYLEGICRFWARNSAKARI